MTFWKLTAFEIYPPGVRRQGRGPAPGRLTITIVIIIIIIIIIILIILTIIYDIIILTTTIIIIIVIIICIIIIITWLLGRLRLLRARVAELRGDPDAGPRGRRVKMPVINREPECRILLDRILP